MSGRTDWASAPADAPHVYQEYMVPAMFAPLAERYGISVQTVKNVLCRLYEKYHVTTRLQLVVRERAHSKQGGK